MCSSVVIVLDSRATASAWPTMPSRSATSVLHIYAPMLVVEVCTSRLPSACSWSVGSPELASTIATNDAQVSWAYRSSAPAGATAAAAGPAGAEGASSPVNSAAARIGTSARNSLIGRIASSFDPRHQQRAAHTDVSVSAPSLSHERNCPRMTCRQPDTMPARHHYLIEEATTSSQRSTPQLSRQSPSTARMGPLRALAPRVHLTCRGARRMAPLGGSGAAAPSGALRAINPSARPRLWRTFGPRHLRWQSQPDLTATLSVVLRMARIDLVADGTQRYAGDPIRRLPRHPHRGVAGQA